MKSTAGLPNHINRKTSLEQPNGLECWTCRKQFSKEELLNQHYKTVLHKINCRRVQNEEMSEMPIKTIPDYQEAQGTEVEKAPKLHIQVV